MVAKSVSQSVGRPAGRLLARLPLQLTPVELAREVKPSRAEPSRAKPSERAKLDHRFRVLPADGQAQEVELELELEPEKSSGGQPVRQLGGRAGPLAVFVSCCCRSSGAG